MRPLAMSMLSCLVLALVADAGCSKVNVEAKDESQPPHEQIFRDEMPTRSANYQRPSVIELPPAQYPPEAADLGLSGLVMIRVLVGFDGDVVEAEVIQGLHPLIDSAALAAARGGRYAPAIENEAATDGYVSVPFRYPPPSRESD